MSECGVCQTCHQAMKERSGCKSRFVQIGTKTRKRIPFNSETHSGLGMGCQDCGVAVSTYHHPGCSLDMCPICKEVALIDCAHNEETTFFIEEPRLGGKNRER